MSLIWAGASVLVQYIYSDNFSFDSPFLLTYVGVSLFTTLIPLEWLSTQARRSWQYEIRGSSSSSSSSSQSGSSITGRSVGSGNGDNSNGGEYQPIPTPNVGEHPVAWSTMDHVRAAAKIAPVWFISNYTYNASLKYTTITSSTVLASTGSLFTFLFAVLLKDEHFNMYKFLGIALGMAGSIITGLHDVETEDSANVIESAGNDNEDEKLWGDALGLLSAVGYGAYAVMVRVLCPRDDSLMSMQLFLGFVGLWNMVVLSPIALCLVGQSGLTWLVFGLLTVKGLFDNVLSDYLWARSVVLTSATVATVGLALTIPLAFLSDIVMGRPNVLDLSSIAGAFGVLAGFILVNLGQKKDEQEHAQDVHHQADEFRSEDSHELQSHNASGNDDSAASRPSLSLEYRDYEPSHRHMS